MDSLFENFSGDDWERFCETMLRNEYGVKYFWTVPAKDSGDLGIEFFTADGTIFQCYFPEKGKNMQDYKKSIQSKINKDLKKLHTNEGKISELLDSITINQWVLLIPDNESKDLITYCNKKKKEVIVKNIKFIENDKFIVKIETAESFPRGKIFASSVCSLTIDIPLKAISDTEKNNWKSNNSSFSDNIIRKSACLMGDQADNFEASIVENYIQNEMVLERLLDDYPDLFNLIEDSASAQLDLMKQDSLFTSPDSKFVQNVIKNNRDAFSMHSSLFSAKNIAAFPFGYLSKWIAECYMDFKK